MFHFYFSIWENKKIQQQFLFVVAVDFEFLNSFDCFGERWQVKNWRQPCFHLLKPCALTEQTATEGRRNLWQCNLGPYYFKNPNWSHLIKNGMSVKSRMVVNQKGKINLQVRSYSFGHYLAHHCCSQKKTTAKIFSLYFDVILSFSYHFLHSILTCLY